MSRIHKICIVLAATQMIACATKPKAGSVNVEEQALSPAESAQISSVAMPEAGQGGSDGKQIEGLVSVHFPFDSAAVVESDRKLLEQDVQWIKAHPNMKVQIEGHCDSRGSVEYNLALGERRARYIQNYLIDKGIEKSRLSIISYGEERPLVKGDSEEAFAKNRRANFVPMNMPRTLSSN